MQADADEAQWKPSAGKVLHEETSVDLANMTEKSFVTFFGEPYWQDQGDWEIFLFYEFIDCEWQVEFDLDGRFQRLLLTDSPFMSDEQQRQAYGVTRFWPPDQNP